jgi:tetratricopeptide (TPR) repeat protein/transcriptional regulator with XRE-family HTH domain
VAHADALDFGRELRRLRRLAGISLSRLALSVHYSKSYLSKVENGVKPATRDLAARCEQALGVEGALVGLCPQRGRGRVADRTDSAALVPRQLPAPTRHFSGRASELALLDELFQTAQPRHAPGSEYGHREYEDKGAPGRSQESDYEHGMSVAVLCGPGGVGKTALAVHWAHRVAAHYPDGQLFVNLRGFDPAGTPVAADEALRGFLDALQIPAQQVPVGLDAQAALYRSATATKRLLVVLDNAREAEQVRPLLPAGADCAVLITSRDPLAALVAAEGIRPVALDLFGPAQARELLIARLGAARVEAERHAADRLLELCAGLPLAINIVAARAATRPRLSLGAQVEQMQAARSRLDALSTGDQSTDVRAVFSWSYRLLSAGAMRAFRLLGLHPGATVGERAAVSLLGLAANEVHGLLDELVRAHLLACHTDSRYAMHDLIRAYAAELATAVGEDAECDSALLRVLEHYVCSAQDATALLNARSETVRREPAIAGVRPERFADYDEAMAWCEAERACLIGAVADADAAGHAIHAWQLASALTTYLDRRSLWAELAEVQRIALAAARRREDARGEASSLRGLGRACMRLRAYTVSGEYLRRALDIYTALGDLSGLAHTNHDLALASEQEGEQERALGYAVRALELFQAVGDRSVQANACNTVGWFYAMNGQYDQALEQCRRALALYGDVDDSASEVAGTWDSLGLVYHRLGDFQAAAAAYQRAIDLYRKASDRYYEAGTLVRLGDTQSAAGDHETARAVREQALAILDELRHPDAAQVRASLHARVEQAGTGSPSSRSAEPK